MGVVRGALAIVCLAFCVYLNALHNPFIYDDHQTVRNNPSIANPSNFPWLLEYTPFRPVVNVSFALDRAIWGYRPFGFHLTNVILHAAVALLTYVLILLALSDLRRKRHAADATTPASRGDVWAAIGASALFAVHPLMTEAVGYISGRSELWCGLFFLPAFLCGRAAMNAANPSDAGRRRRAVAGLLVFGLLALFSKEIAVALPIVLLAYDWLVLPGPLDAKRRRLLLFAAALLFVAAAAWYRLHALAGIDAFVSQSPLHTALSQAIVIWRYLRLLVLPAGQSIMHSVHEVTTIADPLALAAVGGLAGLVLVAIALRHTYPLVAFGLIWYLSVIAPSSSVVVFREPMAEHRAYFASVGVFVAVARLAARWFDHAARVPRAMRAYGTIVAIVIGVLSALTTHRNAIWHSPAAVWREAAMQTNGIWQPHYALADALREAGDCAAAVPEYEVALRLHAGRQGENSNVLVQRDARTNRGICLAQMGRKTEAETAFKEALAIDPTFARGYSNLAALARLNGDPARARDYYLQAIATDKKNVVARMQLARLYEESFHDYRTAAGLCDDVRAIAPYTPGVVECIERNTKRVGHRD